MATVEQMQKVKRDLRRIEKAAERLIAVYDAQLDAVLRQMDATPAGPEVVAARKRADELIRNSIHLERTIEDVRSMDEWVEVQLRP